MSERSQLGAILGAFAVGAVVGAGIALLYAPQSGRETRELITRKTRELKDKVEESFDEAKDALCEKKAKFVAAVQAGRQAYSETKSEEPKSF